jgi:hypothetical protein
VFTSLEKLVPRSTRTNDDVPNVYVRLPSLPRLSKNLWSKATAKKRFQNLWLNFSNLVSITTVVRIGFDIRTVPRWMSRWLSIKYYGHLSEPSLSRYGPIALYQYFINLKLGYVCLSLWLCETTLAVPHVAFVCQAAHFLKHTVYYSPDWSRTQFCVFTSSKIYHT